MNDDLTSKLILQRIDDMVSSIHDLKDAQMLLARDSQKTSLKLERVLSNIEELFRTAENQKSTQQQVDRMDVRLALVENAQRETPDCTDLKHESRITKIEHSQQRFLAVCVSVVIVVNLLLLAVKEIM